MTEHIISFVMSFLLCVICGFCFGQVSKSHSTERKKSTQGKHGVPGWVNAFNWLLVFGIFGGFDDD